MDKEENRGKRKHWKEEHIPIFSYIILAKNSHFTAVAEQSVSDEKIYTQESSVPGGTESPLINFDSKPKASVRIERRVLLTLQNLNQLKQRPLIIKLDHYS